MSADIPGMAKVARIVAVAVAASIAYGACFLIDAQPARHTTWPRYIALGLLGGLVLFVGELVAESIAGKDRVTDPLRLRAARLGGLLALTAIVVGVLWVIWRVA